MKKSFLMAALSVMILTLLGIVGLGLSRNQPVPAQPAAQATTATLQTPPTTALQANLASTATTISGCPPRPTRIPPPPVTLILTPPTPAPPPTPGPLRIEMPVPVPTLIHPLETDQDVLKVILEIDMRTAEWDDPWCLETPRLQPGRITVNWYANEKAADGSGRPDAYGGADPVWVVIITGDVQVAIPCMACAGPVIAGGVRYTIDRKTGQPFGISTLSRQQRWTNRERIDVVRHALADHFTPTDVWHRRSA